ncbi:MAG: TraM recognition domain-containing protein [Candidatus Woesebacteria bacterium]|nr:MAG: TraM recognition domain-containing protein [Candidatus Woesebacteria bacterium]
MAKLVTLLLKLPRNTEVTPESAQTFLAALTQINSRSTLHRIRGIQERPLALEIALVNQQIRFQITCSEDMAGFVETQIQSNYPLVLIEKVPDSLENQPLFVTELTLKKGNFYPLAIFSSFTDIDPLSSILSVLSKSNPDQISIIQFALESTSGSWQSMGQKYSDYGTKKEDGTYSPRPDSAIIKEKISYPGFLVSIRLGSNTKETLRELSSAFGVFTRADANSFSSKSKGIFGSSPLKNLRDRTVAGGVILNLPELATVWHLPSAKIKTSSIVWGTSVLSEPPDNLPISDDKDEKAKEDINFFGKVLFKNRETIYGIKTVDRRRHIWLVGKTGTGKSTFIANMAIDDLKKGRGLGVIDPHGDLCDIILDFIPSSRINDTVIFNPADKDFPIVINPLEVKNKEEAELVVSGIVAIFNKIFGFSWGPRLEYILRNTLLTLAAIPDSTLENVLTALTNPTYRKRMIDQTTDPVLKNFWVNEFSKMPDKQREEAVAPILNKVGQFVTSPLIRRIIGSPHSSIQIDQIMNEGKIILANLSQGRVGEDNAALLGAMLITKFQLAAMRRVDIPETERRDFFLYVDEFQNFATPSFMKILSEARKYRLSLMLANQYMAQIPEEVQKSILGNAGTIVSFTVGAEDGAILQKEFGEVFTQNDLVNLVNHQVAMRLMVDGHSTRPFLSQTLPLPQSRNQNKQTVIKVSRERWSNKTPIPPPPVIIDLPPTPQPMHQQQQGYRPQYHSQKRFGSYRRNFKSSVDQTKHQ